MLDILFSQCSYKTFTEFLPESAFSSAMFHRGIFCIDLSLLTWVAFFFFFQNDFPGVLYINKWPLKQSNIISAILIQSTCYP